jgi:mannitol/fructose-specific phosphotransferase system IIA component (Ntr-type)
MKLRELADAGRVYLDVDARDVMDALEAAAQRAAPRTGIDASRIVQALLDRERLGSTSVGGGFAIPHCKIDGLEQLDISLLRFAEPVEFGTSDDSPVRFFFVVLSPPDQPAAHLQILSQIARILKREDLRSQLMSAADPDDTIAALRKAADAEGL